MMFAGLQQVILIFVVAFWILVAWAIVSFIKTQQRIASSLEQLVRQKQDEERPEH